jgi:RNA polymerase primary sigma factor
MTIATKPQRKKRIHKVRQKVRAENQAEEATKKRRFLTREEEHELGKRIQKGDSKALDTLVMANISLVTSLAKKYAPFGLPIEDLIGEGTLGLVEAARRFDPYRGTRFTTYAVWSVKRAMIKAVVEQRGVVSLPYHKSSLLFSIKRAANELSQKKGSPVSMQEVANEIGISENQVGDINHTADSYISLDAPIDSENSDEFYALCENEQSPDPFDILEIKEDGGRVRKAIEQLPTRERNILKMHYGLDGGEGMTFIEIGQKMGLSRQRVQQLESRAIGRLQGFLGTN